MVGEAKELLQNYDLLSAVMICLKPSLETEDNKKGIIDLLSTLFSSEITPKDKKRILETDFQIAMEQEVDEAVTEMCNYSDYIEAKGIAKGENLLADLINHLLSDNRLEDIRLATIDEDARQKFYEEYGIAY